MTGVPLRILVAEDNEFNRDLLEYMLAGQGLSATMVVDGREALALLERELFDLLLLDIHMPELDGFQVVRGDPGARANGGRPPARHRLDRALAEERTARSACGRAWTITSPSRSRPLTCGQPSTGS